MRAGVPVHLHSGTACIAWNGVSAITATPPVPPL